MDSDADRPRNQANSGVSRFGLLSGIGAYTLWGFAALYWPLAEPASALEILAHRVVWTLVVCLILVPVVKAWPDVKRAFATPRLLGLMALAALLISLNWGTFIWAVIHNEALQASLGYFINPIISVMLGVLIFGERMRPAQWLAAGIGSLAMVILVLGFGGVPWVSLILAVSFGLYGLVKKRADLDAIPSLTVESALSFPLAAGYLLWLAASGTLAFGTSPAQTAVLMGAGLVTAVPLLLFGAAAVRLPLSTLGILQYIGPVIQFLVALLIFGETMTWQRWAGFILIWIALIVFTLDLTRNVRSARPERPGAWDEELDWPT